MMVSTCPSCLTQISHEDHLFEVLCSQCHARFNPFAQAEDAPVLGGSGSNVIANFAESDAVFEELRDFGDSIKKSPAAGSTQSTKKTVAPKEIRKSDLTPGECLMTAGDSLQGYTVESYLSPLSVMNDLDLLSDNPMKVAFEALWRHCTRVGGNAVVGLHWCLSTDGNKVLLSGTPVRCSKNS